jgi:hypothetical protein
MARRRHPPDYVKEKAASLSWQEEVIFLIMARRMQPPDHGKKKAASS